MASPAAAAASLLQFPSAAAQLKSPRFNRLPLKPPPPILPPAAAAAATSTSQNTTPRRRRRTTTKTNNPDPPTPQQPTQQPLPLPQHSSWPPLILCFGPAKASFIPYANPSHRVLNHHLHQAMPDTYWSPPHFFRAPGSAASSVAIALARLHAHVDFLGKLGTDSLANHICSQFQAYGVHTRCTKIDDSASTAISYMKLTPHPARLTAKCLASSLEDTLLHSDVNWHVLKQAKMLYFNSSALLDSKSKSTLMEVITTMKSQGSLIFFDVNLPLPLWHSSEEAKSFLKEAFAVSNFIELTQHELDFLCEIEQNVTNNRRDAKFVHRSRKRLEEFWHDDLKVFFVTNGTSGVSYYTKESDQYFVGTEDVQIEPSSCDMSASGDALVAALMKMLVSEPDKATDPSYLETSIWYAIESGMMAQTLATLESGFYSD